MTYGVDECRVCGAPMRRNGPNSMQRYLDSLTLKKPTMTKKEWRAAGFKAMPTPWQIGHGHDGCCANCRFPMALKKIRPNRFIIFALAVLLFVAILIFVVGAGFT